MWWILLRLNHLCTSKNNIQSWYTTYIYNIHTCSIITICFSYIFQLSHELIYLRNQNLHQWKTVGNGEGVWHAWLAGPSGAGPWVVPPYPAPFSQSGRGRPVGISPCPQFLCHALSITYYLYTQSGTIKW